MQAAFSSCTQVICTPKFFFSIYYILSFYQKCKEGNYILHPINCFLHPTKFLKSNYAIVFGAYGWIYPEPNIDAYEWIYPEPNIGAYG